MQKVCSTKAVLFAALCMVLAGCDENGITVERPRTLVAVVTAQDRPETKILAEGLKAGMDELGLPVAIGVAIDLKQSPKTVEAMLKLEPADATGRAPTIVVAPAASEEQAKSIADTAFGYSVPTIIVGVDAPLSPRVAHTGPDVKHLARTIHREALALARKPVPITLLTGGDSLIDLEELSYALITQSPGGKPVSVTVLNVGEGRLAGRGVLVTCGPRAAVAAENAKFDWTIVVDGGNKGFGLLESGKAALVLEPNWFRTGVNLAGVISKSIGSPWIVGSLEQVPLDRVTREGLSNYLRELKKLPPRDPPSGSRGKNAGRPATRGP